jgi:hypothetical protein
MILVPEDVWLRILPALKERQAEKLVFMLELVDLFEPSFQTRLAGGKGTRAAREEHVNPMRRRAWPPRATRQWGSLALDCEMAHFKCMRVTFLQRLFATMRTQLLLSNT